MARPSLIRNIQVIFLIDMEHFNSGKAMVSTSKIVSPSQYFEFMELDYHQNHVLCFGLRSIFSI